jgi:Gamma-glutamyltransferase
VAAVNKAGGAMSMEDLKNYKALVQSPVHGTYRGYSIYSTPPASSGGTHIVQLLNIMENFPVKAMKHNSPDYLHHLAEAMKMVFADRQKYMADTAFVNVPLAGLASKEYAKELAEKIRRYDVMKDVPAGDPWPYNDAVKKAYLGGGGNRTFPPAPSPSWTPRETSWPPRTR